MLKRSRKGRFFKLLIKILISKQRNGLKTLTNLGLSIGKIHRKQFLNGLRTLRKTMTRVQNHYKRVLSLGLKVPKRLGTLIGMIFISQLAISGINLKKLLVMVLKSYLIRPKIMLRNQTKNGLSIIVMFPKFLMISKRT